MPALKVQDLTVWFERQERPAVEEVSFSLEEGQMPAAEARRQIGYVPQRLTFDLTLPLTVEEAVRMPLLGARGPDAEGALRHFTEALGVADLLDKPLGSLSGGQLKRTLIARAMVTKPRLLLLARLYGPATAFYRHHPTGAS